MVISRLDKQGVHFPHYGQVITDLDFIQDLKDQGVGYVYLADAEDEPAISLLDSFGLARKDNMRPPVQKSGS
ncbi:MAG: hypothetical protein LRY51_10385 [Geovibrio sp.]|nr:hypothetical protein [Geovibrio sp.]